MLFAVALVYCCSSAKVDSERGADLPDSSARDSSASVLVSQLRPTDSTLSLGQVLHFLKSNNLYNGSSFPKTDTVTSFDFSHFIGSDTVKSGWTCYLSYSADGLLKRVDQNLNYSPGNVRIAKNGATDHFEFQIITNREMGYRVFHSYDSLLDQTASSSFGFFVNAFNRTLFFGHDPSKRYQKYFADVNSISYIMDLDSRLLPHKVLRLQSSECNYLNEILYEQDSLIRAEKFNRVKQPISIDSTTKLIDIFSMFEMRRDKLAPEKTKDIMHVPEYAYRPLWTISDIMEYGD